MGLFGTDGIRGVAGEHLTAEFALRSAVPPPWSWPDTGRRPRFVIGRDTRLSGTMLEAALVAGITSGGGMLEIAGVIPTPGLAALVTERGADAGVVLSASHNPYADNGIKFFSAPGLKLSDEEEAEIEDHVLPRPRPCGRRVRVSARVDPVNTYVDGLLRIPLDLGGCGWRSTAPTARCTRRRRWRCATPAPTSRSATRPTA